MSAAVTTAIILVLSYFALLAVLALTMTFSRRPARRRAAHEALIAVRPSSIHVRGLLSITWSAGRPAEQVPTRAEDGGASGGE